MGVEGRRDGEMTGSRRVKFARDAVDAAIGLIEALPGSADRDRLLAEARACHDAVEGWHARAPTPEQHEETMRVILKLHQEASRLGRTAT